MITATWSDNAPHLSEQAKKELEDGIPEYQRAARVQGIPQLGAGVIYPIPDEQILCEPFTLPDHYLRGYGMDVGWNRTAVVWDAKDPETGTIYRYDEYYGSQESPTIHAAAIKRRGLWIPGRIDPASRGRSQADGQKLLIQYREAIYGPDEGDTVGVGREMLQTATNAIETGIYAELMALQEGRLKIFRHRCPHWLAERRFYRRDEKGRIIKKNDHAMDAGRYRTASGDGWLRFRPAPVATKPLERFQSGGESGLSWMSTV